jgi:hypothetical protein
MTCILNLFLVAFLQTPAPVSPAARPAPVMKVVVGMTDGQKIVVENPEFSGFIQGSNGDAVLIYRQSKVHGQLPLPIISRIDFGPYKKGEPFAMSITLKNGQNLRVESEYRNFIKLHGKTDIGMVTINHPDPISAPVRLRTKPPNRIEDLTIQYLEFSATTG